MIEQEGVNVPIDFVFRVLRSPYRELHLWRGQDYFAIGKNGDTWWLYVPAGATYRSESLDEVVATAEKRYPEIRSWLDEFEVTQ